MNRVNWSPLCASFLMIFLAVSGYANRLQMPDFVHTIRPNAEPMQTGRFEPTWDSLAQYETPEWFRDAKFGIWAHWGPQCEPEQGDWYARQMYFEGHRHYRWHVANYGHPSTFGFKDVIHEWKAENWNPEKLLRFYKEVGAQYFVALANHHDNFDLWDSTYQPWNSVAIGPQQNIIARWAEAARKNGLPFGVSVHASHASIWYETARGADRQGPLAGVPYDGNLTKEEGKGTWWEGLDPQDLYAQNQPRITDPLNLGDIHRHWNWTQTDNLPDLAYCEKFYNRTLDLLNKYKPDLIYFDDSVLPLYPFNDAGFKIAAHFYNSSMKWNNGELRAVMTNKILSPEQRKTQVWDIERGYSDRIEPVPWQTCTCLGSWHYEQSIYENRRYKNAQIVIHMLADIVSKNGNLLLSVPLRGDGTLDSEEEKILNDIRDWMAINSEGIIATRPWKVFGEGPALKETGVLQGQGFNEGRGLPMSAKDVRYTVSKDGKTIYAIVMGRPETSELTLHVPNVVHQHADASVSLLGYSGNVRWRVADSGQLTILWPAAVGHRHVDTIACVFKLSGFEIEPTPGSAPDAIVLTAQESTLFGQGIRKEQRDGRVNLGYWDNRDDSAHWLLTIRQAGEYRFWGEFAALEPSELTLQINGRQVAFSVPSTGDWAATTLVQIGSIGFDRPGVYHIRLVPGQSAYRPVNLWRILCEKK